MSINNKQEQLQPPTTNRKEGSETSANQHFNTPPLTQQYLSINTNNATSNRNRSWKDEYLALPTPIREHFRISSSERQTPIPHSKPLIHYQQQSSQFCGDEQPRPRQMYPQNKPNRTYFPGAHHQQIGYTNQSYRQYRRNPKLYTPYKVPYLVVDKLSDLVYLIQRESGAPWRVANHDKLKPYEGTVRFKWAKGAISGAKKRNKPVSPSDSDSELSDTASDI